MLNANAGTITLKNLNLNPMDVDGDAVVDLLHMPAVKTYSVYGIVRSGKVVQVVVGPEADTLASDIEDLR